MAPRPRHRVAGALPRLLGRAPWWAGLTVGALLVLLGAVLTTRPFTSLSALVLFVAASLLVAGAGEILVASTATGATARLIAGVALLTGGLAVALLPKLTLGRLAFIAGLALVVGGLARLGSAVRADTPDRAIAVLSGSAGVTFGVLALSWPDATVLLVALLVGPATVLLGAGQIVAGLRRRGGGSPGVPAQAEGPWARRIRRSIAGLAPLTAVALLVMSAAVHGGGPRVDDFFDPPGGLPDTPGALIRAEPFGGIVPPGATAWRILYTTTRDAGIPAVASAVVLRSDGAQAGDRPVIAWAHGTTGVDRRCAPSLFPDPFNARATPGVPEALARGWVVVATDYVGLGTAGPHPYLIGQGEARSVLDAVRAARHMDEVGAGRRTVVWGHSQGGHAALWTGALAATYAPELDILGVAAIAPASDLPGLVGDIKDLPIGKVLGAFVAEAYSQTYPDVRLDALIRPSARTYQRATAGRCLQEPAAFVSVVGAPATPLFAGDPTTGPIGARLDRNTPRGRIDAPLLIAQGADDDLIVPRVQDAYVAGRCAAGQAIDYRTYPDRDHLTIVTPDSPLVAQLVAWTEERLAGAAGPADCVSTG